MIPTLKIRKPGLPWCLSGKRIHPQWKRHGFHPVSWKFPHATEQLSPCSTTTEPMLQSQGAATTEAHAIKPVLHNRSHCSKKPAHHNWRVASPRSPQLEEGPWSHEDAAQPKKNKGRKERKIRKLRQSFWQITCQKSPSK